MSPLAAFLMLIAAMAMVGANVPIGKHIAAFVPVELFLLFRFVVASLALALLVRWDGGRRLGALGLADWGRVALMALIGMVGFTLFMIEGVKRTSGIDAGVITATLPAVVTALGALLFGERLGAARLAAIGMAAVGLGLIATAHGPSSASTLAGNVLVGCAVLCEALFVMLAKRLAADLRPIRLAFAANLAGIAMSAPLAAPRLAGFDVALVPLAVWGLMVWYVLAASVFSLLLWYRGLPHIDTSLAGLATAALPLAALTVSVLGLGEHLNRHEDIGALMVLAAIVIGARGLRHPPLP